MSSQSREGESAVCIFDGDCGICQSSVRLAGRLRARVHFIPFQKFDFTNAPIGLTLERAESEVVFVSAAGNVWGGAAAVAQILRTSRIAPLGVILDSQLVLPAAQIIYSWVARNRGRLAQVCGVDETGNSSTEY
jgi:predicted DCC family thiol-disulfide oxidoreductase YuxK